RLLILARGAGINTLSSVAASILSRREPGLALEGHAQVLAVVEARERGDLLEREPGSDQKRFGSIEPGAQELLVRRPAQRRPKAAIKDAPRDMGLLDQVLDSEPFGGGASEG